MIFWIYSSLFTGNIFFELQTIKNISYISQNKLFLKLLKKTCNKKIFCYIKIIYFLNQKIMYGLIVLLLCIVGFGLGILVHWLLSAVIVVFILATSIRIVFPKTVKSVEFLGKFSRILRPGLNFIIPILEWTRPQQLFRQNLEVKVDWVSKDNVTVYIGLNVIYYVEDDWDDTEWWLIYKSIYNIDNPIMMMRSTIDEQLRAMMTKFDHKGIFTKRDEIWSEIEKKLREKLSTFGYRIDSIQVKNIDLNDNVMKAMNKVAEAQREKEAATNQWEAEKIKLVKNAEADKEAKILIWEWIAWQRKEIAKWFKEAMDRIKKSDDTLTWDKVLQFLIDSTRIETLGNIWEHANSRLIYLNENLEWREFSKDWKILSWSSIMNYQFPDAPESKEKQQEQTEQEDQGKKDDSKDQRPQPSYSPVDTTQDDHTKTPRDLWYSTWERPNTQHSPNETQWYWRQERKNI